MNAHVKFTHFPIFTNFILSQESKEWLKAFSTKTRYCHYFALSVVGDKCPMGTWDAPFFSIDELNEFAQDIYKSNPELDLQYFEGAMILEGAMRPAANKYWENWQQKHKERIANIELQKTLKAQKNQERKEKLLKRLEFDKTLENSCYYFSVFQKDKEVFPFGLDQTPFFAYEEAEKAMQRYELFYSEKDFYIGLGALDLDYMLRGDGKTEEIEQRWIDQHKQRLEDLFNKGDFTGHGSYFSSAEEKKDYQHWLKTALNSFDNCHYFIAEAPATSEHPVITASPLFYSLIDALTFIAKEEARHSHLNFTVQRGLIPTSDLMKIDGRTHECFQKFINQHKARLESLSMKEAI
ncbi:hypothetical protein OHW80_17455 [Acinetobacter baumannii]|nr:hypothetical protein [Acinetobacter baumannii]